MKSRPVRRSGAGANCGDQPELDSIRTFVKGLSIFTRAALQRGPDCDAIVLVHGLGVSSRYMVPLAQCLRADYCVYAPDMPGFGLSGKPRRVLNITELADFLALWLDSVGLARAVFLGNSIGCQVVADLALRYPQRVSALVLAGPTFDAAARMLLVPPVRACLDALSENNSLLTTSARDYLRAGPRRLVETLRAAQRDHIEYKLPLLIQPTLITRGEHDWIVPQEWCEELVELADNASLVVIPDASHAAHFSDPQEMAAIIRSFLAAQPD